MAKVLLLKDGGGWIVDRIVNEMVRLIPHDITVDSYCRISEPELMEAREKFDIIHYGNWDCWRHMNIMDELIKKPFILTIRSHRYGDYVKEVASKPGITVHAISKAIQEKFPGSVYIPDGTFEYEPKREFTVGFSGKADEYKGFPFIQQACNELGVTFKPAIGNVEPDKMGEYYDSVDLVVAASVAEGHATPIMECLMRNKPFLCTRVGLPSTFIDDFHYVERDVESIKRGIRRFYTQESVNQYSWDNVCKQFTNLYNSL